MILLTAVAKKHVTAPVAAEVMDDINKAQDKDEVVEKVRRGKQQIMKILHV